MELARYVFDMQSICVHKRTKWLAMTTYVAPTISLFFANRDFNKVLQGKRMSEGAG